MKKLKELGNKSKIPNSPEKYELEPLTRILTM